MTGGRGIVNIDTIHQMVKGAINVANNATNVANNTANVANNTANVANDTNEKVNAQTSVLEDISTNVKVSGDLSSVEQVNALAGFFIRSISKINFAISCIDQYRKEINHEQNYAKVLRPIFASKFTDNSIDSNGYVSAIQTRHVSDNRLPKILFFEADETQDNLDNYQGKYAYLNNLRKDLELATSSDFNEIISTARGMSIDNNDVGLEVVYTIHLYVWNNGVKISIVAAIPDILHTAGNKIDINNGYIKLYSGFNLTPIMGKYKTVDDIPTLYLEYLNTIRRAFKNFYHAKYGNADAGKQGTIYQFGPVASFNKLRVISSHDYSTWNGKLISECYIPGSNINMPKVIYQINDELNKNYTGMHADEIVMVQYAIGDDYYTGVIKMINDTTNDITGLGYQIISIKIDDIISPAATFSGDIDVQGNLQVSSYDKQPIIITDNTRRITTFHDKVGINQHAYEVDALLDVDNLTKQDVLELFTRTTSDAVNSSDIMEYIRTNTSSVSEIPSLFDASGALFDYKYQCSVFTSELKYIITKKDIIGRNDFDIHKWSPGTFSRIQQLVKEVKQMSSEYTSAKDDSFMFTFVELFENSDLLWFFATIKAIILKDASGGEILIFVLTKIDVTSKMNDPSYTNTMSSVVDYISRINRNLNYNILLFKNTDTKSPSVLYNTDGTFLIDRYNQEKQNNPYFSRGFDLLPESYMFFYDTSNNVFKYHGNFIEWSGNSGYECWSNSLNAGRVLEDITHQLSIKYNGVSNGNFCVKYIWAGLQKITFVHKTKIGEKEYIIGSGVGIKSILNRSLKVRGEGSFSGDFIVNDAYDNVIFKVDNVNRTISNAYNVGVGTTTPQSMLDVKDTSVQDVIDEAAIRINQLKLMNPILDAMRSSEFSEANQTYNLTTDPTYKQYTVVYKIDMSTLHAEDVTVVYHQLHTEWNQHTLGKLLGNAVENRSLLQKMITFLQETLDSEMIFDGNYFIRIFNHTIYGDTNVGHAIVKSHEGSTYIYTHNTSLLNYNVRYALSRSVDKLFETREYISKATANLWRQVKGKPTTNFQEGQNVLYSLMQRNEDIKKYIYQVTFDVNDPVNPDKIYFAYMGFTDTSMPTIAMTQLSNCQNDIIRKFIHMINATVKMYNGVPIKPGYLLSVVYEDNRNDYLAVSRCFSVSEKTVTLIVPEFCLQDVLKPALSVVGDAKVMGDIMISDASGNFVSIDPVQKFVGINTDDRIINYPDRIYTTTTNADDPLIGKYDAKHHVHVKGKTYPVMVSERIQEISKHENDLKPQYFGTCSGFTVKRTSELYDFEDIDYYAQKQNKNEALDPVTKVKYGPDISFEVCDKTNRTVELGNVQMTVDDTETKNGNTYLKGGFGVQVIDPPTKLDALSTNRNIMYVDNGGTLFINKINLGGNILSVDDKGNLKINLGGNILSVDDKGNLMWGGEYVSLSRDPPQIKT
jgi:hypothetical protein